MSGGVFQKTVGAMNQVNVGTFETTINKNLLQIVGSSKNVCSLVAEVHTPPAGYSIGHSSFLSYSNRLDR